MPILDGLPSNEAELKNAVELAAKVVELGMPRLKMTPKQQSVIDLVREGVPLADIVGITKEQRDAMFAQGCRLIQYNDIHKARDLLLLLYQLEPMDARVIYALGVTFQMDGDFPRAAKLYVQFLALDASNAEGFIRLGECHLAAKEIDNATGCFKIAIAECDRGHGTTVTRARAALLLNHIEKSHIEKSDIEKSGAPAS